jgi:hypothetical protein
MLLTQIRKYHRVLRVLDRSDVKGFTGVYNFKLTDGSVPSSDLEPSTFAEEPAQPCPSPHVSTSPAPSKGLPINFCKL